MILGLQPFSHLLRQGSSSQARLVRVLLLAPVDNRRFFNRRTHRPVEQPIVFVVDVRPVLEATVVPV